MHVPRVPVGIVGGGPVGLCLALMLAKFGVRSVVFEKNPSARSHPQAHFINNRTMEILHSLDDVGTKVVARFRHTSSA
jgi:2-polyprenyl-6-methoxyphenol hydroxylase-like FAD-dependent oxidoreductase